MQEKIATIFKRDAEHVYDKDGNEVPYGPDALEEQRRQMQEAEKKLEEAKKHPEKVEEDGVSVKEKQATDKDVHKTVAKPTVKEDKSK